jgi:four helix bundle protein
MKVKSLEDLQVWQRARTFGEAVFAITRARPFDRDPRLREQLNDAADSVMSNIAEGFGQSSDRAFARYLSISMGSTLEVTSHLAVAMGRKYTSPATYQPLANEGTEIVRMLAGLIRHLVRCNWKNRV